MVQKNYLSLASISSRNVLLALLFALGIISSGVLFTAFRAEAASSTKIVVTRVLDVNTYFSGTKANIDGGITAASAQLKNPATFANLAPGTTHTITVSKSYSGYTLKNFKMCTYPDINTTCTATISVPFTCSATECTTSKITVGTRPVKIQAQFGTKYSIY